MRVATTSERIKQAMAKYSLRQADVVKRCDLYSQGYGVKISKSELSQYISGKFVPTQRKLSVLAAALGVTEPWLMGYDIDPNVISFNLTPHERNVILAYRQNDAMQEAVDKLLGVEAEKKTEKPG